VKLGCEREVFFFEKKKQKTFAHLASASPYRLGPGFKSFLVLFFKKEPLSFAEHTGRHPDRNLLDASF
jgi:hypothetical protein